MGVVAGSASLRSNTPFKVRCFLFCSHTATGLWTTDNTDDTDKNVEQDLFLIRSIREIRGHKVFLPVRKPSWHFDLQ
jgi:hypothetical protein